MLLSKQLGHPAPCPRPASPAAPRSASPSPLRQRGGVHTRSPRVCVAASADDGSLYLGMDFGTSGARATVIDEGGRIMADTKCDYGARAEQDWAATWERAFGSIITQVPEALRGRCQGIAIDGTSATALLVDRRTGAQLASSLLYNVAMGPEAAARVKEITPPAHTASSSSSTLCKVLQWHLDGLWQSAQRSGMEPGLLHKADWLASLLHADRSVTDWNNALKLGYDPEVEAYPEWLTKQEFAHLYPARVIAPGQPAAPVTSEAASQFGFPRSCIVAGGTTDSNAAFIAAGVTQPGQAVTSLGSTMVIKMLSSTRVDDATYGVYSHRLGNAWLVGGASNTGGVVLRQYFSDEQLAQLTERIDMQRPSGLDYYPLPKRGERFPIVDPSMEPRMSPRPDDDALFLQGILEGMSGIEAQAYALLKQLGAQPGVKEVFTAGGGAVNDKWTAMRSAAIGVPVRKSAQGQASYGSAILARQAAQTARSQQ